MNTMVEQQQQQHQQQHDEQFENIPEEFICPLTLNLMKDPVMVQSGRSFERTAILQWLGRGNLTCPLTRQTMHLSDLVTNHALQMKIQKWKQEQRYDDTDETERTDDDDSDDSRNGEEDDDELLIRSYGLMHVYISPESLDRYYLRQRVAEIISEHVRNESQPTGSRTRQQPNSRSSNNKKNVLKRIWKRIRQINNTSNNTAPSRTEL